MYDEIKNVTDNVSTNVTNNIPSNMTYTILANVTNTLTNPDGKKVRYKMNYYFAHSFISDHITIHNRYYLLSLCKI